MPLHMRIPKRGFNNIFAKDYAEVNLGMIQKALDAGRLGAADVIDHAALKLAGLARGGKNGVRLLRSEEHTSELQSLMRISYAVFCLKKKKKRKSDSKIQETSKTTYIYHHTKNHIKDN